MEGLRKIGFELLLIDECLFYRKGVAILVYVDDCIVVAKTEAEIDQVVVDLKDAEFNVTDEGDICDYLGV